jgi:xanthosine utilization system XapX-like protein
MGLEKIVYIVASVIAGVGFVGFVYAKLANRPRHGPSLFALFILGVVGLLFWSIFVGGLKDTIAEAVVDGRDAQDHLRQWRLGARYRGEPPPKPVDTDLAKIAALKQALHTTRLFGWREKDLTAAYHKSRQSTGGSDR